MRFYLIASCSSGNRTVLLLGAQPRCLVRVDTGPVASLGDLADSRRESEENPMSNTNTIPDENDDTHEDIMYPSSIAFILVHLACLGAIWSGITWHCVVICLVLYWGPHLRHRRGVPSLLCPPGLFDQPGVPICARGDVAEHGTEKRTMVGIEAPPSPSIL